MIAEKFFLELTKEEPAPERIDERITYLKARGKEAIEASQKLMKLTEPDSQALARTFLQVSVQIQTDLLTLERIKEDRNLAKSFDDRATAQERSSTKIAWVIAVATISQVVIAWFQLKQN